MLAILSCLPSRPKLLQKILFKKNCLVDVSDVFFSVRGGGRGVRGAKRGGSIFCLKSQGGWGFWEGEGPRGRERVCGELRIFFWGGVYQHDASRCTSDQALRMHSLWRCSSGSSTCCAQKKGLGLLPIVAAERERQVQQPSRIAPVPQTQRLLGPAKKQARRRQSLVVAEQALHRD